VDRRTPHAPRPPVASIEVLSLRRRCVDGLHRETSIEVRYDARSRAVVDVRERHRPKNAGEEWHYSIRGAWIAAYEIDEVVAALLAAKRLIAESDAPQKDPP
jgi:hypothetical protein